MLTELTFCHKSSTRISIDNRYYNRFIQLGRPIFPVKYNGAVLFTQSRPHLGSRMRVSHSRCTGRPIFDQSRIIATRQLDAFTVPSTHYVSNNCIYVRSHVFTGTDSIVIDLMTMKDWLYSQHRPLAPRHQQSFYFFLLAVVIAGDCPITLAFHMLRIICHIKKIITIYFHIWT